MELDGRSYEHTHFTRIGCPILPEFKDRTVEVNPENVEVTGGILEVNTPNVEVTGGTVKVKSKSAEVPSERACVDNPKTRERKR